MLKVAIQLGVDSVCDSFHVEGETRLRVGLPEFNSRHGCGTVPSLPAAYPARNGGILPWG